MISVTTSRLKPVKTKVPFILFRPLHQTHLNPQGQNKLDNNKCWIQMIYIVSFNFFIKCSIKLGEDSFGEVHLAMSCVLVLIWVENKHSFFVVFLQFVVSEEFAKVHWLPFAEGPDLVHSDEECSKIVSSFHCVTPFLHILNVLLKLFSRTLLLLVFRLRA